MDSVCESVGKSRGRGANALGFPLPGLGAWTWKPWATRGIFADLGSWELGRGALIAQNHLEEPPPPVCPTLRTSLSQAPQRAPMSHCSTRLQVSTKEALGLLPAPGPRPTTSGRAGPFSKATAGAITHQLQKPHSYLCAQPQGLAGKSSNDLKLLSVDSDKDYHWLRDCGHPKLLQGPSP